MSIMAADLPARGLAHVISVRRIACSLDAKWPPKREGVWEFLERTVKRHAPGVFLLQLNEVDFLLGFPDGPSASAAARSTDILREVFEHFLGRSDQMKNWIRAVPSLEAGLCVGKEMAAQPDLEDGAGPPIPEIPVAAPANQRATEQVGSERSAPDWDKNASGYDRKGLEWTTVGGEPRWVPMALRPVWSLEHGAVSSFRLYRGFNPIALGYGPDRERLDLAVLDYATGPDAIGLLDMGTYLHLPIALETLLLHRSRMAFLQRLKPAREQFRKRVLLELEGVDQGVVVSRLQEVVHILRPFFKLVLASSTGNPFRTSALRSVGISGAIIDVAAIDEPMTKKDLADRISKARKDISTVIVHGLFPGEVEDGVLKAAGASHVSDRPGDRSGLYAQSAARDAQDADSTELERVGVMINARKDTR